jgi:hypothetical protein
MRYWILHCFRGANWRCHLFSALGLALLFGSFLYGRFAVTENAHDTIWALYALGSPEEDLTSGLLPAVEAAWEAETGQELAIEAIMSDQLSLEDLAGVERLRNARQVIVIIEETSSVPANP